MEDGRPLGIVHRDVSPSNILISLEGEVKLCDFGIAHANDVVTSAAYSDDVIKGKAGYMSPEQASGSPLDARADVFAIGILLFELLAGRRLYKAGEGGMSLLDQARAARIPDLVSRGLPLEENLFAIVKKALAPNRDHRYASAQALLRDLETYVAESKLVASPLRFGDWLIEKFGDDLVQQRRARERAAQALEGAGDEAPEFTLPPPRSSRRSLPPATAPTAEPVGTVKFKTAPPPAAAGGVWFALAGLVIIGLIIYFLATR
jgi:serine/threonine protein kinase